MKTTIKSLLFSTLLLSPSLASAEEVTVIVKGMVCSFCAQGIKKTFGKIDSVKSVNVDLDKKVVTLHTEGNKPLSDEEITRTINDAGYDVLTIERGKDG